MNDIAIRVENLGKLYHIGGPQARYKTIRESITDGFKAPFRRASRLIRGQAYGAAELDQTIWALKDVSFEVKQGEVVGIIGRNGAGKSTLLKILSRITEPTEGEVMLRGRVGSLLEVGTGFHPELTGRENIYLNGAILGMKRKEIDRKLDEIVSFSEIEKFIDTPVKHYSNGMYVRLAFSVAAYLEPETLLVDEVLAVGDVEFQKKCMGKLGSVAKEGRTVLFVSHNMTAIRVLCERGILLDKGLVMTDGKAVDSVQTYLSSEVAGKAECSWDDSPNAPGNEIVHLKGVRIVSPHGKVTSEIDSNSAFYIEVKYWNKLSGSRLGTTVVLYNQEGTCVLSSISNNDNLWHGKPRSIGLYRSKCEVRGNLLNEGRYRVSVIVFADNYTSVLKQDECVEFEIRDAGNVRGDYFGGWSGVVRPMLKWSTEKLDSVLT